MKKIMIILFLHFFAAIVGAASSIERREMELVFAIMWQQEENKLEIEKSFDLETKTFSAKLPKL